VTLLQAARGVMIAALISGSTWGATMAEAPPLSGDHRLLLGFVEDGTVVSKAWFEAAAGGARYEGGSDIAGSIFAAFRFGRDVEAGVRGGVLHRTREAGSSLYGSTLTEAISATGPSDLQLYGKYRLMRSPVDLSIGGAVDLPLAAHDSGLTSGAVRARGFVAVRGPLRGGTAIVGHAGVAVAEDAGFGSASGRTAGLAGFGVLVPLSRIWTFSGEFDYQGALFDGERSSSVVAAGLDWRPTENIAARGGLTAGLSGQAPNVAGIFSLAFYF
jgi:hypothetical protein